jgi:branched-chain amino acid transport system permease protein
LPSADRTARRASQELRSNPLLRQVVLLLAAVTLGAVVVGLFDIGGAAAAPAPTTTAPAAPAAGSSVTGTLTAGVNPVAGARITASQAGKVVQEARSDDTGTWTLRDLPPGTYELQLDPATLPEGVTAGHTVLPTFRVFGGFTQHALFPLVVKGAKTSSGPSTFDQLLDLFVSGIRFGLIVALCAVGLSMIYGTTGLVNFAHGELVTFGALIAYLVNTMSSGPQLPFVIAAIIGVAATGLLGAACELGIFRPMVHRRSGAVSQMLVSIGLALFLRYIYEIVFNASPRSFREYAAPSPVKLGPIELPVRDYVIIVICFVVLVAVALLLTRSRLGTAVRAVADERDLSSASGINVERVVLLVWISGAALAGLGGIMLGLGSEGVQWNMGFRVLLTVFAAVILGGLGSPFGAMAGGLVVGIASQVGTYWLPSDLQFAIALAILILVLLTRPQGIFGVRERIG